MNIIRRFKSRHNIDELIKCAENIYDKMGKKIKFSFFARFISKEVQIIKTEAKVQGKNIQTKEELLSIIHFLKKEREQNVLRDKWDNLIFLRLDGIGTDQFKRNVEQEIEYRLKDIKEVIKKKVDLDEVIRELSELGLSISSDTYKKIKFESNEKLQDFSATLQGLTVLVRDPLRVGIKGKRIRELSQKIEDSLQHLKEFSSNSEFNSKIFSALKDFNHIEYCKYFDKLKMLQSKSELLSEFKVITSEIAKTSPKFAENLTKRKIDEDIINITDLDNAWKASYLDAVLNARNSIDPISIQDELNIVKDKLKRLDSMLIEKLSIHNQLSRITPSQRQSLRGFVIIQNKITKSGRGVRDAGLRKNSKIQMKKCRGAVPVWIMPLAKVMDNFTIGEDVFDVLIIDEASQADITNLPIFSIAKKVIVVGDDKQVSPSAVGIELSGVDELISEYLRGIPNQAIYDYKASLYDIACSSFGKTIRLSEHFRCTPEIIQFCNDLQYQGGIKALRESSSNPTPPSIVPRYVEGEMDESKKNHEEAIEIASIIVAMTKNEEYAKSTIGVISLFGLSQYQYIDKLLRSCLSTVAYEKHRILCGKAPQFQGDERNIIFLSMVESPLTEGPLRLKSATDMVRKEYNVAVSRAKDQLWIMHSMSPEIHLQPEDIRLRLLKHAKDPRDLIKKYSYLTNYAKSPFELEMLKNPVTRRLLFSTTVFCWSLSYRYCTAYF